jgi:hypothetical protein
MALRRRQPLLVIGHSAGGILARLAMSRVPFQGYGMVASTRVPGAAAAGIGVRLRDRFAGELYSGILGEAGRTARGDGIVPVGSAHLDGAVQITLDDVVHGQFGGAPWCASEAAIDRWWPAARAAWRAAVQARGGPGARRD